LGQYLKIGHAGFHSHPLKFISYSIIQRYSLTFSCMEAVLTTIKNQSFRRRSLLCSICLS
jgi:hypothetical protein